MLVQAPAQAHLWQGSVSRKFLTLKHTTKGQPNMKQQNKTAALVTGAMIAALYTALCIALAPISFGLVQFRVAETLTILPVAIPGLTVGCALSNLIGFAMGTNIIGFMDVIFGTLATFLSAILSRWLRKVKVKGLPILAPLPPVLINALIVGAELTYATTGTLNTPVYFAIALQTGVEQFVPCYLLGLLLYWVLERTCAQRIFPQGDGLARI